uniref:Uncharacterized protein n=1 Tax=Populus trichocarpa TaxID=3694 RepID=A9PGF8_POPTR|nr:unknown [Populus trichocarpa]
MRYQDLPSPYNLVHMGRSQLEQKEMMLQMPTCRRMPLTSGLLLSRSIPFTL